MRPTPFFWLLLAYLVLFVVGYWPKSAHKATPRGRESVYSIPVTLQVSPRDS